MNRIDRLTALLIHLQGKPRVPIEELELRFEVSRRTIFRDIKSLLEAGVPIGGDAGHGYFIVDGYHLPPVIFNKEEAGAILIGAKLIEKNTDSQLSKNFEDALFKIKAVLRSRDKEYLENLDSRISVVGSPYTSKFGFPESHILEIQSALASRKVLSITYHSNYRDQITQREIEPLGLVYYAGRWHLIVFCRLRQGIRDLRTDRIKRIQITGESYDPEKYPDYLDALFCSEKKADARTATIRFTKKISRSIQEQKFYYGFINEKVADHDHVDMTFLVPHYEYLARWLLMYGNEVEVLEPENLQKILVKYVDELHAHHCKNLTSLEKE